MEKKVNIKSPKYYFRFTVGFKTDFDVENFGKMVGLKPYKFTTLSQSKELLSKAKFYNEEGQEIDYLEKVHASFSYKTEEIEELYVDDEFEKFVQQIKDKISGVLNIIKENNGEISFSIIFTNPVKNPCLYFSTKTIKDLAMLDASIEFDYH